MGTFFHGIQEWFKAINGRRNRFAMLFHFDKQAGKARAAASNGGLLARQGGENNGSSASSSTSSLLNGETNAEKNAVQFLRPPRDPEHRFYDTTGALLRAAMENQLKSIHNAAAELKKPAVLRSAPPLGSYVTKERNLSRVLKTSLSHLSCRANLHA